MNKYSFYCTRECPIGKSKSDDILWRSNSAFDAAFDMQQFVNKCSLTCKYENKRREFDKKENKTMDYKNINHPPHYTDGKIEVIDFIEDKKLNFHTGNAVKYIARAGKKNGADTATDLGKAVWYLNREIQRITGENPNDDIRKKAALDCAFALESAFAYYQNEDTLSVSEILGIFDNILKENFDVEVGK